jgi:SAM-dependent methyltransferase
MSPAADDRELGELYDHYYDRARFEIPPAVAASLEQLAISFASFRQTGRWLDVGYGEGGLLKIVEHHGWRCYGAEISPPALEYGHQMGWIVTADAETDSRFPAQGFDVVTMIEFLEHVPAPAHFLKAAARWLRPGGVLYITTPNAQSLNRWLLGLEWSIFAPPEHVTIWTARGLTSALIRAGFRPQRIRTEGLNPVEILARWRHQNGTRPPVNRNQTAVELNDAFSRSPLRRALKSTINHCLSAFRLGDGLKVLALRDATASSEG